MNTASTNQRTLSFEGHMKEGDRARDKGDSRSAHYHHDKALGLTVTMQVQNSFDRLHKKAQAYHALGLDFLILSTEYDLATARLQSALEIIEQLDADIDSEERLRRLRADVLADLARARIREARFIDDDLYRRYLLKKASEHLLMSNREGQAAEFPKPSRQQMNECLHAEVDWLMIRTERIVYRHRIARLYRISIKHTADVGYRRDLLITVMRFSWRYRLQAFFHVLPLVRVEPRTSYAQLFAGLFGDWMHSAPTRRK